MEKNHLHDHLGQAADILKCTQIHMKIQDNMQLCPYQTLK